MLDGAGQATATLDVPPLAGLVGSVIDFAFFTVDGGSGQILHPSTSDQATILP